MSKRIFVSYSRRDAALVTPVVRLLRATKDVVFLDSDSIRPGKKWRTELSAGLMNANLVVVFWCLHSSESLEVAKEYKAAVRAKKDVLPVLLDSTPAPADLREFQWIDFRDLAREQHGNAEGSEVQVPRHNTEPFMALPDRVYGGKTSPFATFAIVALGILVVSMLTWRAGLMQTPSPLAIIAGFLVALGLMATVVIRRKRVRAYNRSTTRAATGREKQMAESLKEELLRRLRIQDAR